MEQHQKQTPELFVYVCKKVIGGDFKVILLATSSLSLLWGLKPCFHSGILLLLKVSKLCKLPTVSFWTDNNLMKTNLVFFFSFLFLFHSVFLPGISPCNGMECFIKSDENSIWILNICTKLSLSFHIVKLFSRMYCVLWT